MVAVDCTSLVNYDYWVRLIVLRREDGRSGYSFSINISKKNLCKMVSPHKYTNESLEKLNQLKQNIELLISLIYYIFIWKAISKH